MDLFSALRIALRRWQITASVLLVTIIGAVSAYLGAATIYSAENYVVVVPGTATNVAVPGDNEFAQAQAQADSAQRGALVSAGGARLIANLLVTNLNSSAARAQFGDGPSASYGASSDAQLPVVTINASGSDEAAVTALLGRVVDGSDAALSALQTQAGIPPAAGYRAPRFAPNPQVTAESPDRTKVVVAIVVAGVALAVLIAVALDGPLTRREQRRATAEPGDREPTPTPSQNDAAPDGGSPGVASPLSDRPRPRPGVAVGGGTGNGVDRTERMPSTTRSSYPGR